MEKLLAFFFPSECNKHRTPILRYYSLAPLLVVLLIIELNLNLYHSTFPKILGFATSIYKQEILTLVNGERTKHNLPPVKESSALDQAAYLKAQDMFAQNYWAHVAPDGTTPWEWFEEVNYQYIYAGENLAKDFDTSAGVVAGWLASSSHRENVFNQNFSEMGIAVVNGSLLGEETTLVVQFFATPTPTYLAQTQGETTPPQRQELYPQQISTTSGVPSKYRPSGIPSRLYSGLQQFSLALNPRTWGVGQKVMIGFLSALILLFVADAAILWRKRVVSKTSHSLIHAGILSVLLIAVIWSNLGIVL